MRSLKNKENVYELEEPVDLIVHTKVPMKWFLIDRETGQKYIGANPKEGKNSWLPWNDTDTKEDT